MLNTDKEARGWKTSTVSFKDCTGTELTYGLEGFLDAKVVPEATTDKIGMEFKTVVAANGGSGYCALFMVHWERRFGGIVFGYDFGNVAHFRRNGKTYYIRFL